MKYLETLALFLIKLSNFCCSAAHLFCILFNLKYLYTSTFHKIQNRRTSELSGKPYFPAIVSISIKTPKGNSFTAKAALAGGFSE